MGVFSAFDVSASGMTAQRTRLDVISHNIANVNSTRDADGNIYKRKTVVFQEKAYYSFDDALTSATGMYGKVGNGVKISRITEDTDTEGRMVYDPSNPDADENGYVTYPNVNTVTEMTNMIDAIDPAIIRRGRFDHIVEVKMPSAAEVRALLESLLSKLPVSNGIEIEPLSNRLAGRPLSDAAFVVKEAGRLAVKADQDEIDNEILFQACDALPPQKEETKKIGFTS